MILLHLSLNSFLRCSFVKQFAYRELRKIIYYLSPHCLFSNKIKLRCVANLKICSTKYAREWVGFTYSSDRIEQIHSLKATCLREFSCVLKEACIDWRGRARQWAHNLYGESRVFVYRSMINCCCYGWGENLYIMT